MRKRKRDKKSKRAKNKQRTPKRKRASGPFFFKHPFSEIPRQDLIPTLVQVAKDSGLKFHQTLNEILKILRSHEPLQVIATLSAFGLSGGISKDGKFVSSFKDSQFGQSHVELAQALCLTIPRADLRVRPPDGQAIQKLFDLLPKISQHFMRQRMVVMGQERSDEAKAVNFVQELLRMHTQVVRNWGYFDKVQRIINDLYSPLDAVFVQQIGLSVTQLAIAFHSVLRNSEKALTATVTGLREVFAERTIAGMIRKYYQVNPDLEDSPDELIAFTMREKLTLDQTKYLVVAHIEYRQVFAYMFTAVSLASQLGVEEDRVKRVFDRLSLSMGELESRQIEHLFLDNPVWRKPVIREGEGRYFCAIPQMFFSFVRQIVDDLIQGNPELERACEKRRAVFLETEISKLFTSAFPGAEIVAGFKWKDGDQEFENDLIVRVDSHLFVIEAKSGTVSWPALRGAPERAKKHVEELLIAPSLQSARLVERIEAVLRSPELREVEIPGLNVRLDLVHTVIRLSVTLEDFATIQSHLGELRRTGWLPQGHALAVCMLFSDLEIIFEILEPKGQKIHYLRRRTELSARMPTMGDELDHLGLYLGNGFNMGEAEFGGTALGLVGMSKDIDDFCIVRAEGITNKKPCLKLTRWWSDILAQVETRGFHRWSDVYNMLLSLSPDEQANAERMFERAKKDVRANRAVATRKDYVVAVPTRSKTVAVALLAFPDADTGTRHARMNSVASRTFEEPHVERCVVLAVNVDKRTYPYATLAVFTRGDKPEFTQVDDLVIY